MFTAHAVGLNPGVGEHRRNAQVFPQSRRAVERNMHQPKTADRSTQISKRSRIEYHSKSVNQTPTPLTTSPASHPSPSNPDPISSHNTTVHPGSQQHPSPEAWQQPHPPPIGIPPRSQSRREPSTHFLGTQDPTIWAPERSFAYRAYQRAQPNQSSAGPWSDRDWSGRDEMGVM